MKTDHSSIVNIKNHDTIPVSRTNVYGFLDAIFNGFLDAIFNKIFNTTHDLIKHPIIIYSSKDHLILDSVNKGFESAFRDSIYEAVKSRTFDFNFFLDESELVFMANVLQKHGSINDYVVYLKTKTPEIRTVLFSTQIEIVNNEPYVLCVLKEPVIN